MIVLHFFNQICDYYLALVSTCIKMKTIVAMTTAIVFIYKVRVLACAFQALSVDGHVMLARAYNNPVFPWWFWYLIIRADRKNNSERCLLRRTGLVVPEN